ncbi:MAG: nitroreductase family protein, partial [Bacteroidota bacterium]
MRVLDLMNWRYATKAMNGNKVEDEKINRILESIRLSPSSIGLQPYELIVVSNPELKKELRTAGNNQSQIEDCSHLVVFAVWDQYTPERIHAWFDLVNEVRGVKSEGWERMRTGIVSSWPNRPQEQNFNHA